jgi:(3S)-malyl-CoA thioesterase
MGVAETLPPRSALYLPASNPRAIEKARTLAADMILLDLEDAVPSGLKDEARAAAVEACEQGFGGRPVAIRINGVESDHHQADLAAVCPSECDYVILPKVEDAATAEDIAEKAGKPLLAMIETPLGVLRAAEIAAGFEIAGLIAGTNDLANELHLPDPRDRSGMSVALQCIVLAARSMGIWALDGVFNDLNDPAGLEAQCREGRALGFDGKTLIHPNQIETANRVWSPSASEIEDARALIAAARGGAQRFRDRMIETMHVEMAERLLARAGG